MKTYLRLILRKIVSRFCERWDLVLENMAVARKYSLLAEIVDIFTQPAKFASMMKMLLKLILNILLRPQKDSDLVLENLALRQQLAIWKRHGTLRQIIC